MGYGLFQQVSTGGIDRTIFLDVSGFELCVAIDPLFLIPSGLPHAGFGDAVTNRFRGFIVSFTAQLGYRDGRDLKLDVQSVQERTGEPGSVSPDLVWCAEAFAARRAQKPTRTFLRCLFAISP